MVYKTVAVIGPFLVPLGAFAVAIAAIVSGTWRSAQASRIKADQRITMINRGMSIAEIERLLGPRDEVEQRPQRDVLRSLANARRAGLILVSSGLGIALFGVLLTLIVREHEVLVVAAAGLIPVLVGAGLLVDCVMQRRDIARLELEMAADLSGNRRV